jgi:mRNA interferase RelE/StbE
VGERKSLVRFMVVAENRGKKAGFWKHLVAEHEVKAEVDVQIKNTAKKYLERIPEPHKSAIASAIDGLKKEPPEGNIRPLTGQGGWRLRVGDFRILYKIENEFIFITHVVPRGQAYTKKTRGKK